MDTTKKTTNNLETILGEYLEFDDNKHLSDDAAFLLYINNTNTSQIVEDFGEMYFKLVTPLDNIDKNCKGVYAKKKEFNTTKCSVDIVELNNTDDLHSRIEYMMNEILNAFLIHEVGHEKTNAIFYQFYVMNYKVLQYYYATIDYDNSVMSIMPFMSTTSKIAQNINPI